MFIISQASCIYYFPPSLFSDLILFLSRWISLDFTWAEKHEMNFSLHLPNVRSACSSISLISNSPHSRDWEWMVYMPPAIPSFPLLPWGLPSDTPLLSPLGIVLGPGFINSQGCSTSSSRLLLQNKGLVPCHMCKQLGRVFSLQWIH